MSELRNLYYFGLGIVSFKMLKERLRLLLTSAKALQKLLNAACFINLSFGFLCPYTLCSRTMVQMMVRVAI